MKECPNCKSMNKDTSKYCIECDKYIGNVEIIPEDNYVDAVLKKEKSLKIKKRIIVILCVLAYYLVFNLWSAYTCHKIFGNIDKYLQLMLWYLPCLLIFFFPYDKCYMFIRKKLHKPKKHIADSFVTAYILVGAVYLFIMYCRTYDIWEYYNDLIAAGKLIVTK